MQIAFHSIVSIQGKKTFYRVRWKGYAPSQDTWEPQDHLGEGCDEVIGAYFDWRASNAKAKQKVSTHLVLLVHI